VDLMPDMLIQVLSDPGGGVPELLGHDLDVDARLERQRGRGVPGCGLTALAVLLAGRKCPALRDEWKAHLAGESGHDPVTWLKARQAIGFVASANAAGSLRA
jgi:hypothetical protein